MELFGPMTIRVAVRRRRTAGASARSLVGTEKSGGLADAGPSARETTTWHTAIDAQSALRMAAHAANEAAAQALIVAEVLDDAFGTLSAGPAATSAPQSAVARTLVEGLSPRQKEVLALVAEGHSNRTIAETLFVSPNTVKTHVASLLSKLHADTRVQLATIAARYDVR